MTSFIIIIWRADLQSIGTSFLGIRETINQLVLHLQYFQIQRISAAPYQVSLQLRKISPAECLMEYTV